MNDILKALGYYALSIAILGTISNLLIAFISMRTRTNSTFVLFRFLALNNALSLYFWNMNHYIQSNFNIDIQNSNIYSCKFGSFVQFASLQTSAWTLVGHLILNNFINKQKSYFSILIIGSDINR